MRALNATQFRSGRRRAILLGLVPVLFLLCGVRSHAPEEGDERGGQRQVYDVGRFRTVVLLLDSVGTSEAFDPSIMPFVSSLMSTSLFGEARACPGRATFPCVKSIFEGRTATTGTTLQDFSAVASNRTTWPASLAALGLRLVVTSDHTLNRLYPGAFVDSMNYESLTVPLLERDAYAYRQARKWLSDPTIDVLLLHIIGTDKVAHEYPVRGPEYRATYLEADNFAREVASQLGPRDYLYVISDHGHNALGGHTDEAAYLAHGPLFPHGVREDLGAPDMLFLLSAPYALTLPEEYEGHIRTDLTSLSGELRDKLLLEQARVWRVATEGLSSDALEARLNEYVAELREKGKSEEAIEAVWRLGPWLLAAALFLVAMLKPQALEQHRWQASDLGAIGGLILGLSLGLAGISFGGWIAGAATFWCCVRSVGWVRTFEALCILALLGAVVFWLMPISHQWFHRRKNQPMVYAVFYPLAVLAGVALTSTLGVASWRQHAARILWTVGLAVWLLAFFGPYNYALTGRGPKIVLGILAPLAIVLAGGVRPLLSFSTIFLFGLCPLIIFHTSSYNIEFWFLERLLRRPPIVAFSLCAVLGLLWAMAVHFGIPEKRRLPGAVRWAIAAVFIGAWVLLCTAFFQFDVTKILGFLLGALWLTGCLELFRRAKLPISWSALAGVIMLFVLANFAFNGFALSHVDFRFAANKIIPFQEEALRAPQLILWAMVKYSFVLLPAIIVLFFAALGTNLPLQLLQLGWWRELMIVISSLGLALFDRRGMSELCGEEIYFWTFLNLVLWSFCLFAMWRDREPNPSMQIV